jgi:hypothetical protein
MQKLIECVCKIFRFVGVVFLIALCATILLSALAIILPDNFMRVVNFIMELKL